MAAQNAQILFPVNVPGAFDYRIPHGMSVHVGDFVFAPIGKQMKLGVVFDIVEDDGTRKLKDVAQVKAAQPLSLEMLNFINWTAKYNCVSPGLVLRMVVRSYKALDPSPLVTQFSPSGQLPPKMSAARQAILDKGAPFPARASEIAERAGVSGGVVRGFEAAGGLRAQTLPVDAPFDVPDAEFGGMELTRAQRQASDELMAQVAKREPLTSVCSTESQARAKPKSILKLSLRR